MRKTKYPYGIFVKHDYFIQSTGIPFVQLCSSSASSWKVCFSYFLIVAEIYACSCQRGKPFLRFGITSCKAQHKALISIWDPQKHLGVQAISCAGPTTSFGFFASVGSCILTLPTLLDLKLSINKDSISEQVVGYGTYETVQVSYKY